MPHSDTYKFYQAYVINVHDLLLAETEIRRIINRALKARKETTVKVQTKLYALIYSTFAEANFMKMVLTPYGFEEVYLNEILKQSSIQEKWLKCLKLGFINFTKHSKGSEIPNKSLALKEIIKEYIIEPSLVRNKIAHGQLTVALNSKSNGLNTEITDKIQELNSVTIYRWFQINIQLSSIIEDLIESPDKAHYRYYYSKYVALKEFIDRTNTWSVESKLQTKSMKKRLSKTKSEIIHFG